MGTKKLLSFKSAAELCAREFTVSAWDADGNEVTDRIWVRTMSAPEMREADNAHAKRCSRRVWITPWVHPSTTRSRTN